MGAWAAAVKNPTEANRHEPHYERGARVFFCPDSPALLAIRVGRVGGDDGERGTNDAADAAAAKWAAPPDCRRVFRTQTPPTVWSTDTQK
jgi:hypothetical protein